MAGPSGPAFLFNFYPRSPCGERQAHRASRQQPAGISIHALLAESDRKYHTADRETACISIHALLAESDKRTERHANSQQEFLSTLSLRRATASSRTEQQGQRDFYPRSPCGERPTYRILRAKLRPFLSTLSLRRATLRHCTTYLNCSHFYPRSPCGERHGYSIMLRLVILFLSTLSLRRATRRHRGNNGSPVHFYPRSPCGERRQQPPGTTRTTYFYPRSPCGERQMNAVKLAGPVLFLSTLSLRRATHHQP